MTNPFVSVVVLNYNGLRFLEKCLGSLLQLNYPRDRYEVVLVDNRSTDGSPEIAERLFPTVHVVRNEANLGFAAGNNVAMRESRGDYVALLNNDAFATPNWLARLVEAAEQDARIGACTSKLLFQTDRVRLSFETDPYLPSDHGSPDTRELGVRLLEGGADQAGVARAVEYLEGFYGKEQSTDGAFRWSGARGTLGICILPGEGPATLHLLASAPRPNGSTVRFTLGAAGQMLGRWDLDSSLRPIELPLPPELTASATPVIQNAGTLILKDGSGRDRGAVVRGTEVYQEDDAGQYDRQEEVFAGCGAALLLKRAMLEDVGFFDEDLFMYYEDMDLSWRARRWGWKIVYVPGAAVRHVHAGSSVEWSPLFLFNVERNRLLMLGKNAPAGMALREHARYCCAGMVGLARLGRSLLVGSRDRTALARRSSLQLRVLASLARQVPRTLAKRREVNSRQAVPTSKLLHWMVEG